MFQIFSSPIGSTFKFKQNKRLTLDPKQIFRTTLIKPTVSFTDLDQGREILSRFSLPKSMKHSAGVDPTKLCFSIFAVKLSEFVT